ncbi:DMT family transporter [Nonomuraea sp. N2-4H]|jgi:drug/metabolite transporter (DMT)-like permease|uniref:DMT family transporter n=1 Tax=unclassified Nonomuraea TaxID=2593643 RepID=UPI00324829E6
MAVLPAPRPLLGAALLLFVSAAWGSAFPLMKDLIPRLPVEDLLAERYLIAGFTLIVIRPRGLRGMSRRSWFHGVILGVLFGVGQTAQAMALNDLPSAVSGFAVGCSVVITPLLSLVLFRQRVPRRIWAGVALALAGMGVFTLVRGMDADDMSVSALGVTLLAAALYSGHTLFLAHLSKRPSGFPAYGLTTVQLLTIGVLTGGFAVRDGVSLPGGLTDWLILAHLSVVSCALGFLARSYGQAHVPAMPSQILMSTQPVWVAAIAVIWFDEPMGWGMVLGGVLMGGATLLALPRPAGSPPPEERRRRHLLSVARRAAHVLAEHRVKREDRLRLKSGPVPYINSGACTDVASCPWRTRSLKGGAEPSLERLLDRATRIVRAKSSPGPGCCQSITLLGRCLCDLMEDSERSHTTRLQRWFRS